MGGSSVTAEQSTPILPVILCGGSGTRLWPLSRTGFPKQFLCLTGAESLFQQAALRMRNLDSSAIELKPPLIVTGEEHRFLVLEQLREAEIDASAVLLEPSGKNTAPALTFAANLAVADGGDPILVVTPSDQVIQDESEFQRAIEFAIEAADKGDIVTLGITPSFAASGYGYIQVDNIVASGATVRRFVEKPDPASAEQMLRDGGYVWNAGIFVCKASVWLSSLERCRPDIASATGLALQALTRDGLFVRPDRCQWDAIPAESIDYAVMERAIETNISVQMVPMSAGWNDLGAWDAVWDIQAKDESGNATQGDVLLHDVNNGLVSATHRLVAVAGVNDVVIVETADAVMVTHREACQNVKALVSKLQNQKRDEHASHRKVHRPWGWYDSIDVGRRFKVKRICVNPHSSLSLQIHHHRAEHWVVVRGTAEVTCGNQVKMIAENQSTYIPQGETHRLRNLGPVPLEIIEIQTGEYLGEDDIVRLDDAYGRDTDGQIK